MMNREIFNTARNSDDINVMNLVGSAADNAALTIGASFVQGNFTEEFICIFIESIRGLLATGEVNEATVKFFADLGLNA